jgi:hypothetical protein
MRDRRNAATIDTMTGELVRVRFGAGIDPRPKGLGHEETPRYAGRLLEGARQDSNL